MQLGTLGAGNHYAEIQVVEDIYDDYAARRMGIDHKGQVSLSFMHSLLDSSVHSSFIINNYQFTCLILQFLLLFFHYWIVQFTRLLIFSWIH